MGYSYNNREQAHAEAIRLANRYGLDAWYWPERGAWRASPWGEGNPDAVLVRPLVYHSCRWCDPHGERRHAPAPNKRGGA